eukprot:scaffold143_cov154-Amphora_coffeaeformis.AAC.7
MPRTVRPCPIPLSEDWLGQNWPFVDTTSSCPPVQFALPIVGPIVDTTVRAVARRRHWPRLVAVFPIVFRPIAPMRASVPFPWQFLWNKRRNVVRYWPYIPMSILAS